MEINELRKLQRVTLSEALTGMKVGEICVAPDGVTANSMKRACSLLRAKGYEFTTTTRPGVQLITRLK